ncbi:MAG: transposase [Acidobacteriota bacterium]
MAKSSQNRPMIVASLPEETARAARAVFNIENVYLTIGDQLDAVFREIPLLELDDGIGFAPNTLAQLALITVFQFAEDLADRAACAALDQRMDWKYALHLPIEHPPLDPAWLCRFRQPLVTQLSVGQAAVRLQTFQSLVDRLAAVGLLGRDKRDIPARSVLEHVCRMNQLDRLHEDVSQAIEVLACHQPDMLRALALPHWYDRYREGRDFRPPSAVEQRAYADALGSDACHVLQAVARVADPQTRDLPEVRRLAAVWGKQCQLRGTTVTWRDVSCELCPWLAEESRCHR